MLHTLFSLASYSVLQRFGLLLEFIVISTNFKVPEKILQEFVHIEKKIIQPIQKILATLRYVEKISAISLVNSSPPLTRTHVPQFDSLKFNKRQ